MQPIVKNPDDIKLAMLGMTEGNGHPYSWSAIFNGYEREAMSRSGYPGILEYLEREPKESFGVPGVRVTHICCDDPEDAERVSRASLVPHIIRSPEEAIGQVDAVIIATDIGAEHVERARPFIEAGLPVFIDKPLADREDHLLQFVKWTREGKPILSGSCMRYAREYSDREELLKTAGELRLLTMTMAKSWEKYGIHGLEGVYPFLEPGGWLDVVNTGNVSANIVHIRHQSGVDVLISTIADLYGAFGVLGLYGKGGWTTRHFRNTFFAFKSQLEAFIYYLRSGCRPFPCEETFELIRIIIAGIRSRDEGGRRVLLSEIGAG